MAALVIGLITAAIAVPALIATWLRAHTWRRRNPNVPFERYEPWGWPSQRDLENDPGHVPGWPNVRQTHDPHRRQ